MELAISKVSLKQHEGKTISLAGIIDSVAQTTGPTLFSLIDGSGTLMLKGFDGAGVRAFPQIKEGDTVKTMVQVKEFQGSLEGEIIRITKLEGPTSEQLRKDIEAEERKRATVVPIPFLVKSQILDKLKERYIQAATEIRLAVVKNRPIIVRHHNDCDGYSSGYSLERAIIPLIIKQHGGGKAPWEYFTRSPSMAPFYEIEDSIKDTANSLRDVAKFSNKMPLVVIVDTGSGSESLLGIRQGKIHGADFIVVDHHFFEEDVTSPEVLVHVNPFVVGEDGAKFSAGMLCTELARFINPEVMVDHLPALSGMADRIDNPTVITEYLKIAEKKGYNKELLEDIASLIDYVSTKLRFMEAREYIEVVFGDPIDKQKALVSLMNPFIRTMQKRGLEIAKSTVKREKIGQCTLQLLFVEETFSRNAYPKPGQVVGMLHDFFQEKEKNKNVVSIGVLSDLVTIRATEESKFIVHDFLSVLQKNVPEAFPEGGGHKSAGALRFVPAQREKVLVALRTYLTKVQSGK